MSQPPQQSPLMEALMAAAVSTAALGAAVWLGWYIGWPGTFDPGDIDFVNPISAMILGLMGASVWFAVKAVRYAIRERRFGTAALDLDPPGHLRLGGAFSGRLRVQRPVAATGPFDLVLTCFDTHEFEENGRWKTVDFPVWSERRSLPSDTDATRGLPFRFTLPGTVGPEPVPSGIVPGLTRPYRATVHVPGMRRIVASNVPPVGRYWTLVVSAPTPGPDFRAEIVVPREPPRRKGRLP